MASFLSARTQKKVLVALKSCSIVLVNTKYSASLVDLYGRKQKNMFLFQSFDIVYNAMPNLFVYRLFCQECFVLSLLALF